MQISEKAVEVAFRAASLALPAHADIGVGELDRVVRAALGAVLPAPMKPDWERIAFNLCAEFGSEFVADKQAFSKAVVREYLRSLHTAVTREEADAKGRDVVDNFIDFILSDASPVGPEDEANIQMFNNAAETAKSKLADRAPQPSTHEFHGPYGWLNGHRGLSEDSWTLEGEPLENSDEYFAIPLYALVDPFKKSCKNTTARAALSAQGDTTTERLAELNEFMTALSEWGCTDPNEQADEIRKFLASPWGLREYLDKEEPNVRAH